MKKHMKSEDGKYHIKGKKYELLVGSRAQVWHGTAYKTSSNKDALKREDLVYNKHGRIVSRKKHHQAKREKRLEKYGYFTKKGQFGSVKRDGSKRRRSRKKVRGTRKR